MWPAILCVVALALPTGSQEYFNPQNDICSHCICQSKTLTCDFERNKTLLSRWNSNYQIPTGIAAVKVQLKKGTQLIIEKGFFQDKLVNGIEITGGHGSDQLELAQDAIYEIGGGFPRIEISNISAVFLRSRAFSNKEIKLYIDNIDMLVINQSAFVNINATCNFTDIRDLDIHESAFSPTPNSHINLLITGSKIHNIHRINMSMNKIKFTKCNINTIRSYAFHVNNIIELCFEDCHIGKIESRAFTSKLFSPKLSIVGTYIHTIEKDAILESGITNLTLEKNIIDTIQDDAIQVNSANVYIQRNNIINSGKNWLRIMNCDVVNIEDNSFDQFAGIQLKQERRVNCTFMNNYLRHPHAGSLNFNDCEIRAITVDRVCDCNDSSKWLPTITEHDLSSELYCQLKKNRLDRCFNAKTMHLRRYNNEVCGVNRTTLRCVDSTTLEWYKGDFMSKEEREEQQRGISLSTILCIFSVSVIIMVPLVVGIVYLCAKKINRNSQSGTERCQLPQEAHKILNKDIDEMQTQPNTKGLQKLLKKYVSGKLTTDECVEITSHIMHYHNQLPQGSNEVIARHMDQMHANATAPQQQLDYSVADESADSTYSDHNGTLSENIYAELLKPSVCVYSLPPDNMTSACDYSEPINAANTNDIPPAYEEMPQYATPQRQLPLSHQMQQQQQQQLPSTSAAQWRNQLSRNSDSYATPVWHPAPNATPIGGDTSTIPAHKQPPGTQASGSRHVRELGQNLESMPQFHPNQLTSPRNQSLLQSRLASNLPRRTTTGRNANIKRSFECLDGAASLAAMEHMDMRGAAALPPDSGSDHSGGSDETVKIEDIIEYADA